MCSRLCSPAKMHQLSMTERLFGSQRKPKGITLAEWPEKPCAEAMAAAQPSTEPGEVPLQLSCVLAGSLFSGALDFIYFYFLSEAGA